MAKYYRDRIPETREKNRLYYEANKERLRILGRARAAERRAHDPAAVNLYKRGLYKKMSADARKKMMVKRRAEGLLYYRRHSKQIKEKFAEYRMNNREIMLARYRQNYRKHAEKRKAAAAAWRKANPERFKEMRRAYAAKNSHKLAAHVMQRCASKLKATPAWRNKFFIEEAYDLARRRTKAFGYKWHVDHIVPLKSKIVCGLHVENNLQVIPAFDNVSKGNRVWPNMPGNEAR